MKHATPDSLFTRWRSAAIASAAATALTLITVLPLTAQQYPQPQRPQQPSFPRDTSGNRAFNPYQVEFARVWAATLSDPVKLIDIGPVMEDKKNNLLLLVGGRENNDYHRKLVVTHWDGGRFVPDSTNDFLGTALDALMVGHFRPNAKPAILTTNQPAKGKKPKLLPTTQIVTTEGVYAWNGSSFSRLFSSPPNLRLALVLDGSPDQMVITNGNEAVTYEAGDTDSHISAYLLATNDPGYVRMAVGTQFYEGSREFLPNVRYAQSFWKDHSRWQIGLEKGKSTLNKDNPDESTGDRLVVYTPKLVNREKSFWRLTRPDDFEVSWRSDVLPGRVLDVRVGDPKNEGKDGILVLTSENNDKERHLYFYAPVTSRLPK